MYRQSFFHLLSTIIEYHKTEHLSISVFDFREKVSFLHESEPILLCNVTKTNKTH
nr:MAG TPA: hypothetical protein [Caudoviricetes sp.]